MSLTENSNKSNYDSHKAQDFCKNPFADYHESINNNADKIDPVESAFKTLNSYCKAQGVSENDIIYWDGQVREMMETVKKIRERVPAQSKVENVFSFCDEELKKVEIPRSEDELKASMAQIEKMDIVLKLKTTEEKKAKLSRIQVEEESRDILNKLPSLDKSNKFELNFQEFMRLLNDVENTETGSSPFQQQKYQAEGGIVEGEKKEKLEQQKSENFKFVERNIRLAKCGRGTLSITDEEKSRLDNLLKNWESPSKSAKELKAVEETDNRFEETFYGIDSETKANLEEIDRKLEALRKKKGRPRWNLSFLEKNKLEKKVSDEDEKQNPNERKKREKSPDRLEKINKLLNIMNSVSADEIKPLTEEEMADLVQQSNEKQTGEEEGDKPEESDCLESKPPEDVIADLVSDAKFLMPKFKYRFDKS